MSDTWDVGDVVPLSVTVTGSNGNPADATTVTLTVTRPDLTVFTATLASSPTGVYSYDFATTLPGQYRWKIVATGTNASVYSDVFNVMAEDMQLLFSVADARAGLRLNSSQTSDDEKLRLAIAAVTVIVQDVTGPILPASYTEKHRTGGGEDLFLWRKPVLTVTSVTEYTPAASVLTAAANPAAAGDYVLDGDLGCLVRLGRGWARDVWVVYTAGRSELPPNVLQAATMILQHQWQANQQGQGRPAFDGDGFDIGSTPSGYAIPYAALDLLKPDTLLPGFA